MHVFLFALLWCCSSAIALAGSFSATVTVETNDLIGAISPHIYGQYLEHVQREDECIYPSIWDELSPHADATGLRRDVIAALRDLHVPVVRWPGGCFADVYHWRDGIGPQAQRPLRQNLHWGGEEPNHFGTDEFLRWCNAIGTDAYINANLGTGTLEECVDWLKYCNQPKRRVTFWGIGNETFGKWESGHMDAATYARVLKDWAGAVRKTDPDIKIMAVGSMSADNPEWDQAVLRSAAPLIDYLTIHAYGYSTGACNEFLSVAFTPAYFEQRLRKMLSTVDQFADQRGGREPIRLAMDEWNIRHYRDGVLNRKDPRTLQDAIFVAGVLNTMIRLSPRVGMANYVFLINGNGVLLVNDKQIVRTPLFHVFRQYAEWMQGTALRTIVKCPTTLPSLPQVHTPAHKPPPDFVNTAQPWLDTAAALQANGDLSIALINRHPNDIAQTKLHLPSRYRVKRTWTLSNEDVFAANTFAKPNRVSPQLHERTRTTIECPPHSICLILCQRR